MTSRVGPKGQVVIPKELRDHLGLHPGDEVDFVLDGNVVRLAAARDASAMRGSFAGLALTELLEEDRRSERRR